MTFKSIFLGAFAASMISGAAFAGALDNPGTGAWPVFTTGSVKAMTAPKAMANSGWSSASRECTQAIDALHNDRCASTQQLGGAN